MSGIVTKGPIDYSNQSSVTSRMDNPADRQPSSEVVDLEFPKELDNTHFQNLYNMEGTLGSYLTDGLRKYNRLFDDACMIRPFNPCQRIGLRIAQYVLGIVIYPVLGTIALIGVLINEIILRMRNSQFQNWINDNLTVSFCSDFSEKRKQDSWLKTALGSAFSMQALDLEITRSGYKPGDKSGASWEELVKKIHVEVNHKITNLTQKGLLIEYACVLPTHPEHLRSVRGQDISFGYKVLRVVITAKVPEQNSNREALAKKYLNSVEQQKS